MCRISFSMSLKTAACAIILVHNHPSGNLKPSRNDREVNERIKEAAALMDIALLDHLIITEGAFMSFADEGYV